MPTKGLINRMKTTGLKATRSVAFIAYIRIWSSQEIGCKQIGYTSASPAIPGYADELAYFDQTKAFENNFYSRRANSFNWSYIFGMLWLGYYLHYQMHEIRLHTHFYDLATLSTSEYMDTFCALPEQLWPSNTLYRFFGIHIMLYWQHHKICDSFLNWLICIIRFIWIEGTTQNACVIGWYLTGKARGR